MKRYILLLFIMVVIMMVPTLCVAIGGPGINNGSSGGYGTGDMVKSTYDADDDGKVDGDKVEFLQTGTGASERTANSKMGEMRSVTDFGAGAGGDDTTKFSNAAKSAAAAEAMSLQNVGMLYPNQAMVYVPAGTYTLSDYLDTSNADITFVADPGAVINGVEYLYPNRLHRQGIKFSGQHHGINDTSATLVVSANNNPDRLAQVSGFTDPNQLPYGNGGDAVALYTEALVPAALYGVAAVTSYSTTGAALSTQFTATQLKQLRKGMLIRTRHATPYRAILSSWTANSITVQDGWFLEDGSPTGTAADAAACTAMSTTGLDLNTIRKDFATNGVAFLYPTSYGTQACGAEYDIYNTKGESTLIAGGTTTTYGFHAVNIATASDYSGGWAYDVGGKWVRGYQAGAGVQYPFYYDGTSGTYDVSKPLTALLYAKNSSAKQMFNITPDGAIEMGVLGTANTNYIDMHSGATSCDHDVRLQATGGNGTAGNGTLTVFSAETIQKGGFQTLRGSSGGISRRFSEIAATTLSGASTAVATAVPTGARLLGCAIQVETAVTSGDGAVSWAAAYSGGATQAICTGQAFTKNTEAKAFFDVNAATDITSNTTNVTITPNSGTFSGGVVRVIVYYETLTGITDVS